MVRSSDVMGKHIRAESPLTSRPSPVLSCSVPVSSVNNVSVPGRGGEAEHALAGVNEKQKNIAGEHLKHTYWRGTTGPGCHSACVKSQPSHVSDAFRAPAVGWKNDSLVEDSVAGT